LRGPIFLAVILALKILASLFNGRAFVNALLIDRQQFAVIVI
jgi:hypothetical protein